MAAQPRHRSCEPLKVSFLGLALPWKSSGPRKDPPSFSFRPLLEQRSEFAPHPSDTLFNGGHEPDSLQGPTSSIQPSRSVDGLSRQQLCATNLRNLTTAASQLIQRWLQDHLLPSDCSPPAITATLADGLLQACVEKQGMYRHLLGASETPIGLQCKIPRPALRPSLLPALLPSLKEVLASLTG